MDRIIFGDKVRSFLKKYRYPAIILAVGVVLMSLPTREEADSLPQTTQPIAEQTSLADSLEDILSKMEGVGSVRVLLTEAQGGETIYQTDEDQNNGENSSSLREETVILSDERRTETGLVRQKIPPVYRGAIIVCQGADQPAVKLAIVNAVANVTGIGADRISVLKMK